MTLSRDRQYSATLFRDVDLVSTDIFDTLLLRTSRSERSRIVAAERRFAHRLDQMGFAVPESWLIEARLEAQKLAYRALNMSKSDGEVRFLDIVRRQFTTLGLPDSLIETRLAIEIEVEHASLRPNRVLADALRRSRSAGQRVVAVSDIALPAAMLDRLITSHHGAGLIDRIYSSADSGATKRRGQLFLEVLSAEGVSPMRVLHIGDDETADHKIPSALGIRTLYRPRARSHRFLSRANGAANEISRLATRRRAVASAASGPTSEASVFGREVLGPIVAEFCLAIWFYVDEARRQGDPALLFCARGGLGIREAFERLASRLQLPLPQRRDNLAISRLIAARAALTARSPTALDELGREFSTGTFADVARACGGGTYELPVAWRRRFAPEELFPLLDSAAGDQVAADIQAQHDLFRRHLAQVSGGAQRIILCDTGLYGSTQRLLAAGMADLSFETIQMARCNYKGLSEDHFPRVVGLTVERSCYSPVVIRSTILRYWQLIETLFEPHIPSVRTFAQNVDGEIVSNAGDIRFGALQAATGNPLLSGALEYIDTVSNGPAMRVDAARAWLRLRQAVTRPTQADVTALAIGQRSVDFGRAGMVGDRAGDDRGMLARLSSLKTQLWREGAIVREFPRSRTALLATVETLQSLRGLLAPLHR